MEFEHFVERRRNMNKIYTFVLNSQVDAYMYCKYCNVFACLQRCGKSKANLLIGKDIFAMAAILVY